MAAVLMKVREELSYCAMNDLDLLTGSLTIKKLIAFNEKNRGYV